MMYSSGNTAKQWILSNIETSLSDAPCRILDLACGTAWIWKDFLSVHPNVSVVGIDTDLKAIERAKRDDAGSPRMELRVFDAQRPVEESAFDIVTALSAIEHVVDREAFLKTVWNALRPGGVAYLNYDVGHFRSHNLKERFMVPVSQVLAMFGIERFYMKRVDDRAFVLTARNIGFNVTAVRKHNLHPLKGFMRHAPPEAVQAWIDFEERLGGLYTPEALDRIMWSTTVVLKKS